MNSREAIEAWTRFRDGNRVAAHKPDGWSIGTGMDGIESAASPDYYGFARVEEALGSLCKLRSQRETLAQLLVHVYAKGLPIRSFNGASFGWEHEAILQNTMDAIHDAVTVRLEAVPMPEVPKSVEMA